MGGGWLQESRLFRILYHLLDRGRATAPELAKKFEVSVRTIYRDVDAISSAGIPIYVTAGKNGGIQLLDDFVLDRSLFSDQEKQEILSSLQSLSVVQNPEIENILKKLAAIFRIRLTDWIDVDFSRWGSTYDQENKLFYQLKRAIFEKRQISFEYFASNGTSSKREILPKKLVFKDKAWYLYAYCLLHRDNRWFRLTRIKNLILTDLHFENCPETEPDIFPQSQDIGPLVGLLLEFPLGVGYRLYDTFDDKAVSRQGDRYIVEVILPENDWLYEFLMSFGDKVTVIRPESVRQKMIERYKAAFMHIKGEKQYECKN